MILPKINKNTKDRFFFFKEEPRIDVGCWKNEVSFYLYITIQVINKIIFSLM